MTDLVDINAAAKAARQLARQLGSVLQVGAALENISDLQNYIDETERNSVVAKDKIADLNEKISVAELKLDSASEAADAADARARDASTSVSAVLAEADKDAQAIRNDAEVVANKTRDDMVQIVADERGKLELETDALTAERDRVKVEVEAVQETIGSLRSELIELKNSL